MSSDTSRKGAAQGPAGEALTFGQAVARWFAGALLNEAGNEKMRLSELAAKTKTSRMTLDRMKNGTSNVDQRTLAKIARALKVPVPRISRLLLFEASAAPPTALRLVTEAAALLDRAKRLLVRGEGSVDETAEERVPTMQRAFAQGSLEVPAPPESRGKEKPA